jgi:hypothetical protein
MNQEVAEEFSALQPGNLFHPTILDLRGTVVFNNNISSKDSLESELVHLRLPRFSEGRMKAQQGAIRDEVSRQVNHLLHVKKEEFD